MTGKPSDYCKSWRWPHYPDRILRLTCHELRGHEGDHKAVGWRWTQTTPPWEEEKVAIGERFK